VLDLTLLPAATSAADPIKNAIDLECGGALAWDAADPERAGSDREGDVITAADTVRVGVLGPLEVTDAAGRPVRVAGQRVRALLILLAMDAGRVVSARSLIELLWPDERPVDAANALQSLVSRLRVALRLAGLPDGVVESSAVGYRLAASPTAVDALAFEAQARAGRQALAGGDPATAARLLREALARWRGPALADVAGDEFAAAPAARLAELRSAAQLDRIEAELALGAAGPALIGELRELTAADSLAERPAALMMRALAAVGRQAEALAVYQRTRDLLAEDLGVDPSRQLAQAYLAGLRQEVPAATGAVGGGAVDAEGGPAPIGAIGTVRATGSTGAAENGERPGTERPDAERPDAERPDAERPGTERPGTERPDMERPGTERAGAPRRGGGWRQPTSFVGRDPDVVGVLKQLAAERLVTLTGPGGVGKTRLAVEAAGRLDGGGFARFAGSVSLVALAPLTEPSEVPHAVLDALGLRERSIARRGADGAADPIERLCAALAERDALLILDNCEHVIEPAAILVSRLLADCPGVRVLATSREPLRIGGESLYVVAPLPVPPDADPAELASRRWPETDPNSFPAVRLFADRAASVLPDFQLDASIAGSVAQICRTLDGMPLAIELAVPWLRTLTPAQLAERLDDRFALLTGGSRASLPRHQTLRATVDWSWQLLSEPERVLARRLAVFPGGATLAAAEQVCADPVPFPAGRPPAAGRADDAGRLCRAGVLTALSGLVGKSIVTMAEASDDAAPRYRMLETVRAYALERLTEAGEADTVRDALACFFCELAETADPLLRTADQMRWFRLLSAEQDNTHAALRWAVARGDAGTALRLVRALGYYWVQLGHGEGDGLAREVLALTPPDPPTKATAEARVICAMLAAGWSYDLESVKEQLIEAVAGIAAWADDPGDLHPLAAMGEPLLLQFTGGREQVEALYDRYATAGDPWLRAMGRFYRAQHASEMGRVDGVEEELRVALREFRAMGERWGIALVLTILADVIDLRADDAATIAALEEAVAIGRELNAWGDLSYVEARLALVRARSGDLARGRSELDRIGRATLTRRGQIDIDRWVTFMRAELAWREGDPAVVVDCCTQVLAAFDSYQAVWWEALRARIRSRLALAVLAQGDEARCRELLDAALRAAAAWTEHPALAGVLDACACYTLRRPGLAPTAGPAPTVDPAPTAGPAPTAITAGRAELAARLLGAAHAVRGAFDESSLDAPQARAAARDALGPVAFDAAYRSAADSTYRTALELAHAALSSPE
jgi:predicted ATPase/DNA-binding SARP family transcriptional activator